ncbi:MAG: GGDEF domain-containing protein [Pseudomonadales bacterium]
MVDWKSKYAELVDQSERQQARYKRRQQLLVAGFLSAIQLARGISEAVDTRLLATQRLLRESGTKSVDLEQGVAALKRASETILAERQESLEDAVRQLRQICAQTRSLNLNAETTQALKIIENDLRPKTASYITLLSALEKIQQVHKVAVKQEVKSQPGFLQRLLGSSDDVSNDSPLAPSTNPLEDESDEDETIEDHEMAAPDSSDGAAPSGEGAQAPRKSLGEVIRTSLVMLLGQLGKSEETQALEDACRNGLTAEQLPKVLDSVCHVGIDVLFDERAEFQSSLSRMNVRLGESQNQIDGCVAIGENIDSLQQDLYATLEERFGDMGQALEKAQDLDSLRSAIQLGLSGANAALETHKSHSVDVHLTKSLSALSEQIVHLNDMGRASQFRVEEKLRVAGTDAETGLPNRLVYQRETASKLKSGPLSLAICRLNQPCPDLSRLIELLRRGLRQQDRCFRLGPDEFAVVMPQLAIQDAGVAAENIRKLVCSELATTISIGVAAASQKDTTESVTARAAAVSRAGDNQVSLAT